MSLFGSIVKDALFLVATMKEIIAGLTMLGLSILSPLKTYLPGEDGVVEKNEILAQESLDLTTRATDSWVSQVMADNILLTLRYLKGDVGEEVDWEASREPFSVSFTLGPGEVFAFHQDVLPEFEKKLVKTTGATFHSHEGFKSDGYLFGDGVCHLASLMNWVASQAELKVTAKINHDFLPVPGVPKEFGTAIYYIKGNTSSNQLQNLYIENPFDFPVEFIFLADSQEVKLIISR